ncbi:PD-(D/E)XK nuclease family protein [Patiriisocius marinistellae]|uniref:PD-(D/E)XK nuclease family protein n=1 Tax=Patiriisocius marinistellae TaxID=2494560 RepID=UPI001AD940E9|nr:PD-(D/E)XK nuclease family protein [Patiriisocius marinistellae]
MEDFTTEVFVGILNLEEDIKLTFIQDFLKLPENNYSLKTQVKYELENDQNCVIDFVLEGENSICFIENKVNSKEGYRQIERYCKVLESLADDEFETHLFYCTKFFDKKLISEHNFKQIRWFQIAKFLKKYKENKFVENFLDFLITHDMAQELTINAKDFVSLENLQDLINLIKGHLNRVKPVFKKTFNLNKVSNGLTTAQILEHNRMIFYQTGILGAKGWSELKYGFQFSSPSIYVSIYLSKSNPEHKELMTYVKKMPNFTTVTYDAGSSINLKKDISVFLNDEQADTKIADWFKDAFKQYAQLIKNTGQLDWKINVA